MAAIGQNFNANEYEAMGDFSPIPAGEYPAVITESEWKATKDQTGQYLQMKVEVIDGEFKDRTLFVRLNLQNKSTQAMDIAKRELATIAKAVGEQYVQDSSQLHNKPMIIKVAVKPADGQYGASNEIKNYLPFGQPVTTPSVTPAAQVTGTGKKPWEK